VCVWGGGYVHTTWYNKVLTQARYSPLFVAPSVNVSVSMIVRYLTSVDKEGARKSDEVDGACRLHGKSTKFLCGLFKRRDLGITG